MKSIPKTNIDRDDTRKILADSSGQSGMLEVYNVGINPTIALHHVDISKTFYVKAFKVSCDGVDGFLFSNVENDKLKSDFYPVDYVLNGSREKVGEVEFSKLTNKELTESATVKKDYFSNLKEKIATEKERTLEKNYNYRSIVNSLIGNIYDLPPNLKTYMEQGRSDRSKLYDTASFILDRYNEFNEAFGKDPLVVINQGSCESDKVRSVFDQIEMETMSIKHNLCIEYEEVNDRASIAITDGSDNLLSKLFVPIKSESRNVSFCDGDSFDFTENLVVSSLDFYGNNVQVIENKAKMSPDKSVFFEVYAAMTNYLYASEWDDLPSLKYALLDGEQIHNQEDRGSLFMTRKLIENPEMLADVKKAVSLLEGAKHQNPVRQIHDEIAMHK